MKDVVADLAIRTPGIDVPDNVTALLRFANGANGLLDGSYIRLPFRAWYVKATGENMENGPAVPDIILDNAPDSKANNRDEQLKKAVDELLRQIDSGK